MTVQSTTQTTASTVTQYSAIQKATSSSFDETLNQTQNTTQTSQEPSEASKQAHFNHIERYSFEFLKEATPEQMETSYNDLSEDERNKMMALSMISKLTENETLNQTFFEEAQTMTAKQARSFAFEKIQEIEKYKRTGNGLLHEVDTSMFEPDGTGKYRKKENPTFFMPLDHQLTHKEAFDFLLQMVNSSKEGMENKNFDEEIRELYEDKFHEYSEHLENYNKTLRKNLTGNV